MNMGLFRSCLAAAAALMTLAVTAQAAPNGAGPTPPPPSDQAIATFVDRYVQNAVGTRDIPGATIVVLREGRPILSKGYGVEDYDNQQAMDVEKSVLRQGSTGKMFVWLLVMQLVEEGRLSLDADLNRYLDFRLPEAFGGPVTMRHLMTHSAGFEDRTPMMRRDTRDAPIRTRLIANMPKRVYAPGSTIAYSNYGAALAAYVVGRLRGKPFEVLVQERIFAPLGMSSSSLAQPLPKHLQSRLVSYFTASSRTPAPFEHIGLPAAGSASASASDMARFVSMLSNGGMVAGHRVLRGETIARMMELQKPLAPDVRAGLGLGFIVGEHRGVRYAGHGGGLMAGSTDFQILPEHGLSWYIAFNGRGLNGMAAATRQQLLLAIIDRFYRSPAAEMRRRGPSSATDLEGSYIPARRAHGGVPELFAKVNLLEVSANSDGSLSVDREGTVSQWLPAGRDRFFEEKTSLPLMVVRDASGRVVRLASPFINSVTEFERVGASTPLALFALVIAPPILLLIGTAKALVRAARRPRQRRGQALSEPATRDTILRRRSTAAFALIVVTILGWAAYLIGIVLNPGLLSGAGPLLLMLNVLAMLTAVAAAALLAEAVAAWGDPLRSWWSRLAATAAAPAALALAFAFFALDLAIPRL